VASEDEFLKHFNFNWNLNESQEVPDEEVEARRRRDLNEKEVKVVGVYEHPKGAFVLLKDARGRAMPIFIGHPEALSISLAIEGHATPRPLTHDLIRILLERFGASLEAALVDDLYNNTYYAKISLRMDGKTLDIDCRPSDAIALALRTKAPIYVADAVLEEAQVEWREQES
jgi:bifunctional DNase/RNase